MKLFPLDILDGRKVFINADHVETISTEPGTNNTLVFTTTSDSDDGYFVSPTPIDHVLFAARNAY